MIVFVTIVAIMVGYIWWSYMENWRIRRKFTHIPGPGISDFFESTSDRVLVAKNEGRIVDLFAEWVKEYGESYVICIRHRPAFFTIDPEHLKQVYNDVDNFIKTDGLPIRSFYGMRLTGTKSILAGSGQTWQIKRRLMTPFFAKTNMENLFGKCQEILYNLIETKLKPRIGQKKALNVHEELSTIFSAYPAGFGYSCAQGIDAPGEIGKTVNHILDIIPSQVAQTPFDRFKKYLESHFMPEICAILPKIVDMRKMCKAMIQKKKVDMELDGEGVEDDIIRQLILANNAVSLTEEDIVDDLMLIYFVADNMTKQLGALFIEMMERKDIFDKMVDEIRKNPVTDFNSLSNLVYTEQVIMESLRLDPTLQRSIRRIRKPSYVGKYLIPDTTCAIFFSQYVQHRQEKHFKYAKTFDPDRWLAGSTPPAPYTYMPFLDGPRTCFGKNIAMMTMKLTLSSLLTNFDMVPVPEKELDKPPIRWNAFAVLRIRNGPFYNFAPVKQDQDALGD